MSDQFVDAAKDRMNFLEKLLKGLPGISGYIDKELRRDADKRLRELIAGELEEQKQALFAVQHLLLEGTGLLWMDNVDTAVSKLQLLADRIRTAAYGYAGLFDPVRIGADELNALHHFDQTLAERVADVRTAVQTLRTAVETNGEVGQSVRKLIDLINGLNTLYGKRHEAVLSPNLLSNPSYTATPESSLGNPDA
jgi:hypothetical protein